MWIPVAFVPARNGIRNRITAGALSEVMVLTPMVFILWVRTDLLLGQDGVIRILAAAVTEQLHYDLPKALTFEITGAAWLHRAAFGG